MKVLFRMASSIRSHKVVKIREVRVYPSPADRRRGMIEAGPLRLPCALGAGGVTAMKREGDGATLYNPTTGEPVATASTQGLDFGAAFAHARDVGGPNLRKLTFAERGEILTALSANLHEVREELLDVSALNGGTTRKDGKFDIDGATGTIAAYAHIGRKVLGDKRILVDGEGDDLVYGRLKDPDDPGRHEGGRQVDAEPDRAPPAAGHHRGKHVFVLIEARHAHDRLIRLLADDVHHVVDSDPAEQFAVAVDHRRGDPVVALKQRSHVLVRQVCVNRFHVGYHHLPHRGIGVRHQ